MRTARLGDFMVRRAGTVTPSLFPHEAFDLYSIPAHDAEGYETIKGSAIGSAKQQVLPGDVMVSKIVPHIRRARVVGAPAGRRQIASGEWMVFRSQALLPAYFRHYLVSDTFHQKFMATVAGVGGSLLRARPAQVAEIEVPTPPLAEQRRIAAVLDQADALRAKRRQTITLLDDLTQAVFFDLFSDPHASTWPVVNVASIASPGRDSIRTGPFGSQLLHSEFVESGIAVLGIDNAVNNEFRWAQRRYITEEKYRTLARYTVHPGDVLITIMGTCGRCAVVPDDIPAAINTKHLCSITVDPAKVLPEFLHASFLWQPVARAYLRSVTKGAIMDGLNMGLIKNMELVLPPIDVQRSYLAQRERIDEVKAVLTASAERLEANFESLRALAFTRGALASEHVPA
jgi:type I restriction enzyme, S subunit